MLDFVGAEIRFRGETGIVLKHEPLGSGMCDTMIRLAGREIWVSSHELKRTDNLPVPNRAVLIREAEKESLASLREIRDQHIRDFNKPWPGIEHGKAIFGMAITTAINSLAGDEGNS